MKVIIALAALFGCAAGSPIVLATSTRAFPRPPCGRSLCNGLPDNANYPLQINDPIFKDRCFFSCSGGAPACQCCNDDSTLYNPFCDACVWPANVASRDCPTTAPTRAFTSPCTKERNDQATELCRRLDVYIGAAYKDMDGDYPFRILNPNGSFITLPHIYASCVGGFVGYCMFCPASLVWRVLQDEFKNDKMNCGICDWPKP